MGSAVTSVGGKFKSFGSMILSGVLHPIQTLKSGFDTLRIGGLYALDGLKLGFTKIKALPTTIISGVKGAFDSIRIMGMYAAEGLVFAFHHPFQALGKVATSGAKMAVNAIKGIGIACMHPISAVKRLGSGLMSALGKVPKIGWLAVIAAVGTALYSLYKTNETFRNGVNNAWNSIKTVVTGVCDNVSSAMKGKFQPTIENLKQSFSSLKEIFSTIGGSFKSAFQNVFGDLGIDFSKTSGIIDTASRVITKALTGVASGTEKFSSMLKSGLQSAVGFVKDHATQLQTAFTFILQSAKNWVTMFGQIFKGIGQMLKGDFAGGLDTITDAIVTRINQLSQTCQKLIPMIANGIIQGAPKLFQAAGQIVQNLAQGISQNIPKIQQAASSILKGLGEFISTNAPAVVDSAGRILEALGSALVDNISVLSDAAGKILTELCNFIGDHASDIGNGAIKS